MAHPALKQQSHRPWPIPQRVWKGRQTWCDVLFAHWPVPAEALRPLVPEPLKIQEYDGTSWVGIVPFRMEDVMVRGLPAFPGLSAFPELNLRLYVEYDGIPGVWFLSLDTTSSLAVWGARTFFHLPYFPAEMKVHKSAGQIHYYSRRKTAGSVEFESVYEPTSESYHAEPGTLEYWLTERYCLYSQSPEGEIYRVEIHHKPWPLQTARALFQTNQLTSPFGISLPETTSILHFSARQDVVVWLPEKVVG